MSLAPGTENTGFVVSFVRVSFHLALFKMHFMFSLQYVHFQNMNGYCDEHKTLYSNTTKCYETLLNALVLCSVLHVCHQSYSLHARITVTPSFYIYIIANFLL